eukprot:SAG11_NODE_19518_length_465_cov_0.696721_2_plen_38_part_01
MERGCKLILNATEKIWHVAEILEWLARTVVEPVRISNT